jgi:hypothetical protein
MFNDLSTRACSSSEDIATFTTLWAKSQYIFDRANQSKAVNSNGLKQIRGSDHFQPQFLPPETSLVTETLPDAKDKLSGEDDAMDIDEVTLPRREVLRAFREREPEVLVEEDGDRRLKVTVPRPARLLFSVETEISGKNMVSSVRGAGNPETPPRGIHTAILRAINTHRSGDLGRLLVRFLKDFGL